MFRCEQIMNEALAEFTKSLEPLKEILDSNTIVQQFGERVRKLAIQALGMMKLQT